VYNISWFTYWIQIVFTASLPRAQKRIQWGHKSSYAKSFSSCHFCRISTAILGFVVGSWSYKFKLWQIILTYPVVTMSTDKNHTGLCVLGFVLIQQNVLILVNIGPQCSVCSISGTMLKCNHQFVENIGNHRIKARTQAPTMTDHPPSHLTFQPWHHSLIAMFLFTNDSPYHHQCWATSPSRSTSSCRAL